MSVDIVCFLDLLEKEVSSFSTPVVDLIAVQTKDPFKVLVATILSARTRDQVTAEVCKRLFKRAADITQLAELNENEIRKLIYPVGFFNNKARFLSMMPAALAKSNGKVPDTMDGLLKLPGVGRKTANLVLAVAFDKPAICVDTHVHRIMNIWGYVNTSTPEQTEMELRKKLPERYWKKVNSILVSFGQEICRPQWPKCDVCILRKRCPANGVTPRKTQKEKKRVSMNSSNEKIYKIISWNVNGLRAAEKKGFISTVSELSPDIVALQETRVREEQLSEDLRNLPGYKLAMFPADRKGYSGVAIYSRMEPENIIKGMGDDAFDREGRVITMEFDTFFLVNAYFPNAQNDLARLDYKLEFNKSITQFASELGKGKGVIMCGDFNVAHKPIDLANPEKNVRNAGFTEEEREGMDMILESGYVDSFRKFNTEPGNYTWWSYRFNARARNIGWRIDYFLVDRESERRMADADILKDVTGSDHCPISLDFVK